MNSCKEIATGLSVNGPRTCQVLGVMLSRHHHISSVPKQVPWTVVLLLLSPGSPRFRLSEAIFLAAHCFHAFYVLQVPEDVPLLEPKIWALLQLCVNIWAFDGDLLPRTVVSSLFAPPTIP